jgi:hypothetical protein
MEQAHGEAERILRKAYEQATAIASAIPAREASGASATTAEEALARLDSVLEQAHEVIANRAAAEEDEAGMDNDTATSGVWDPVPEDTATGEAPRPSSFQVPRDQAQTDESHSQTDEAHS